MDSPGSAVTPSRAGETQLVGPQGRQWQSQRQRGNVRKAPAVRGVPLGRRGQRSLHRLGSCPRLAGYDPEIGDHLAAIEAKYHSLIHSTIEDHLRFEPETATRNRKQLKRPVGMGACWELRLGPDHRFRVFYRVDLEARQVRVLAIAVKARNRLFIAGEEVKL